MLHKFFMLKRYAALGALSLVVITVSWGMLDALASRPVSEQVLQELPPCAKQALRPVAEAGALTSSPP